MKNKWGDASKHQARSGQTAYSIDVRVTGTVILLRPVQSPFSHLLLLRHTEVGSTVVQT